jgi:hypothetical protein
VRTLNISSSHRLNSRFTNFVPFAPLAKAPYAMQLVLLDGAKMRYESYLRIERAYFIHESGLVELLERISARKNGRHLRVDVEGETGIEKLCQVLEKREELVRTVEKGED